MEKSVLICDLGGTTGSVDSSDPTTTISSLPSEKRSYLSRHGPTAEMPST